MSEHDLANAFELLLYHKQLDCNKTASSAPSNSSKRCPQIWDGMMCWPQAEPGEVIAQFCPIYVLGFDYKANATKKCTEDGVWHISNETHKAWTNYTQCSNSTDTTILVSVSPVNKWAEDYLPALKAISQFGYGLSLSTLLIAFILLATLKKLHCPRNMLHLHLFMSFIMRAFVTFMKASLFLQGIGLRSDFAVKNGTTYFVDEFNDNWECKALTTVWQYFIMANYSWVLVEGLYVHNLIIFALFFDSSSILFYVVLGWGLPLMVVVPWVMVKIEFDNALCWTTYNDSKYSLIIRLPTTLSVLLNFALFMNIVRVLLVKVRSSIQEEAQRYWRLAKSTLILVPLFGVHYAIFVGMSYINDHKVELVWLFCDQFFASLQGFFVAVLYCFLNGEVQSEVKKKWRRLTYHGRVNDNQPSQRSALPSRSSSYSMDGSCNLFMLCRSSASRQRLESKASKRTETDMVTNDSVLITVHTERERSYKMDGFSPDGNKSDVEMKLIENHISA